MIGGVKAYGDLHGLSGPEIQAAISAYYKLPQGAEKNVREVQVISANELQLYWDSYGGSYDIMRRVRGKWVHGGGVVVTS